MKELTKEVLHGKLYFLPSVRFPISLVFFSLHVLFIKHNPENGKHVKGLLCMLRVFWRIKIFALRKKCLIWEN